jgi:hypothetical protein
MSNVLLHIRIDLVDMWVAHHLLSLRCQKAKTEPALMVNAK